MSKTHYTFLFPGVWIPGSQHTLFKSDNISPAKNYLKRFQNKHILDPMTKKEFIKDLITELKGHINLNIDKDDEDLIIENIRKGAELKGANLWVLMFAIVIASIGLNVNSTAVIIGAMLISPLMGPLIAIGLGLSIYDFELIKLAIKNLSFALIMSLIASTLYFLITPLDQAQTEILARTSPTIFDVFIALTGGLAGMVATTRKVKTNVIPGVAIATALMPPLCTAGYGIASGNLSFFFGAFYLFIINCVFIFIGSFLIVRMMKFKQLVFVDKVLEEKIRRYIYAMIVLTVGPSSYLAYEMVTRSITERRINEFLAQQITSQGLVIIEKNIINKDGKVNIEVSAVGSNISEEFKNNINKRFEEANIVDGDIKFKNLGTNNSDIVAIKSAIIEELYRNNEMLIKDKDLKIQLLEKELAATKTNSLPKKAIESELRVLLPLLEELVLSRVEQNNGSILLVYLKHSGLINKQDFQKASDWLKVRTNSDIVKIISERVDKKPVKLTTN